jgi:expansin (peptidoglycan-binding protein)
MNTQTMDLLTVRVSDRYGNIINQVRTTSSMYWAKEQLKDRTFSTAWVAHIFNEDDINLKFRRINGEWIEQ